MHRSVGSCIFLMPFSNQIAHLCGFVAPVVSGDGRCTIGVGCDRQVCLDDEGLISGFQGPQELTLGWRLEQQVLGTS